MGVTATAPVGVTATAPVGVTATAPVGVTAMLPPALMHLVQAATQTTPLMRASLIRLPIHANTFSVLSVTNHTSKTNLKCSKNLLPSKSLQNGHLAPKQTRTRELKTPVRGSAGRQDSEMGT